MPRWWQNGLVTDEWQIFDIRMMEEKQSAPLGRVYLGWEK
jgi:hypothetical protein